MMLKASIPTLNAQLGGMSPSVKTLSSTSPATASRQISQKPP